MPDAIEVTGVSFGYSADEPILKNVTFGVAEGEFVGLIGPNGGGKTTLLKLLMGFLEPWEGNISIFSKPATEYPNGIGYVPQVLHYDRNFPISVLDLVLEGRLSKLSWTGRFSKQDKEIALHALEQVNLADFCDKSFGMLSGGQAQRALIARALATEPKALLLDEPLAAVDIQAEADFYEVMHKIRKNLTILMVTHDIQAVIQHVTRVLCVQGSVMSLEPSQVCEHFALGLYHFPLILAPEQHFAKTTFS
ncbi:MAG: metal ABC transporter ATP-binding protein [Verrucomicrobia bacterium]|nr:metal ABC transporter ATP-binding protein [Verrucomicrobiota bacterium]